MNITGLTKENFNEAADFVSRASQYGGSTFGWDSGRFNDWYYGTNRFTRAKDNPDWFKDNCQLFYKDGKITALAISEYGGDETAVMMVEKNAELFRQVFIHLENTWGQKKQELCPELNILHSDLTEALTEMGFVPGNDPVDGHQWVYDLEQRRNHAPLASGFSILDGAVQNEEKLNGLSEVIKNGFNSEGDKSPILRNLGKSPNYRPEFDLMVVNSKGMPVAYGRGFCREGEDFASIDPICCHSDYRKKGLTKALVIECFNRMKSKGIKNCVIGSAPIPNISTHLYQSLAPQKRVDFICYWKGYGEKAKK